MYNEDIKKRYIASQNFESSVNYFEFIFARYSEMEETLHKDIAEFSEAEIKTLFSTSSSINTLRKLCGSLETYTNYYNKNERKDDSADNGYSHFTDNDLMDLLKENQENSLYISRDQLLHMIAEIPNAIDRYLILALYEGIKGEKYSDITMLQVKDIDIANQSFHLYSGKTVEVSEELFETAIKGARQRFYTGLKENFSVSGTVDLEDSDYIFRARNNASNSDTDIDKKATRVSQRFIVLKKFLNDSNFNVTRVFNSGYVYQLKELKKKCPDKEWKELDGTPEVTEINKRYNIKGTLVSNIWRLKLYFDEQKVVHLFGALLFYRKI